MAENPGLPDVQVLPVQRIKNASPSWLASDWKVQEGAGDKKRMKESGTFRVPVLLRVPRSDLSRPALERLSLGVAGGGAEEDRVVFEGGGDVGVLGPEGCLADFERAQVERLGLGVLALDAVEVGEVVEGGGDVGVLGSEGRPGRV